MRSGSKFFGDTSRRFLAFISSDTGEVSLRGCSYLEWISFI